MRTVLDLLARTARGGSNVLATLGDLILPTDCPGCGGPPTSAGMCPACARVFEVSPVPTRPQPPPDGLPPCVTGGDYEGELRELILAYKERGRRGLAVPLGDRLASVVLAGGGPVPVALALVPVPSTAAAIRARHGDHMLRLARRAAWRLRRLGLAVRVATPLRALPKRDSAHLDRQARAEAALTAFAVRPRRVEPLRTVVDEGAVVVVDDVLTTGSTMAAVARRLFASGVPVAFAATLAATRLRYGGHHSKETDLAAAGDGMA